MELITEKRRVHISFVTVGVSHYKWDNHS